MADLYKTVQEIKCLCKTEKHNKYYNIYLQYSKELDRYNIVAMYGGLGGDHPRIASVKTKNLVAKYESSDFSKCIDQLDDLLYKKLFKRGYTVDSVKTFKSNARKCDQVRIKEQAWD